MSTPIGSRIQDLEKTIITNLKETQLVEHPHIYHGNLKDPREPITLAYKVADEYREELSSYDPLVEVLLSDKNISGAPTVLATQSDYDEKTGIHTIRLGLETSVERSLEDKYRLLLNINDSISRYLLELHRDPSKRRVSFRHQFKKFRETFKPDPHKKRR